MHLFLSRALFLGVLLLIQLPLLCIVMYSILVSLRFCFLYPALAHSCKAGAGAEWIEVCLEDPITARIHASTRTPPDWVVPLAPRCFRTGTGRCCTVFSSCIVDHSKAIWLYWKAQPSVSKRLSLHYYGRATKQIST
jgi:hypothetical protein